MKISFPVTQMLLASAFPAVLQRLAATTTCFSLNFHQENFYFAKF